MPQDNISPSIISAAPEPKTYNVNAGHIQQIRSLFLTQNAEDMQLAKDWLQSILGATNAGANLFLLTFQITDKEGHNLAEYSLDDDNCWQLLFHTYPVPQQREHYRYLVETKAILAGKKIISYSANYSRACVGNDIPRFNFIENITKYLHRNGVFLCRELFYDMQEK